MLSRHRFYIIATISILLTIIIGLFWHPFFYFFILVAPLVLLGIHDVLQTKRNILRNYPVIGHLRHMMETIRPQIRQYYIESNMDEVPYSREQWELVKERATKTQDNLPFGTLRDVKAIGYEWINHSIVPKKVIEHELKVVFGGPDCKQPYLASRLNISALSFGALSNRAIRALNLGAKMGGFAHNTGEGGLSPYHLMEGGDIIWQLGTAYFGARTSEGNFDAVEFAKKAALPQVKMIEIKLSQGAKPAHGGILPAAKITEEISKIRGVAMGEDCLSPPAHTAFSTPIGLLQFVQQLRDLSGGKPIGFKLCIGIAAEFMAICKAMLETKITPDFITVDGSEGGTGAAPLEFVDFVGMPLNEGLVFVNNCLTGIGLRKQIRIIASGKIVTGFDILSKIALGADTCNMARPMMFALGCVQSRKCHTNRCPTGVATQDPSRMYALSIASRAPRVHNFHDETLKSFRELLGATGVGHPDNLNPSRIRRRISATEVKRLSDIYPRFAEGALLEGNVPHPYDEYWLHAKAESF